MYRIIEVEEKKTVSKKAINLPKKGKKSLSARVFLIWNMR
jgi:hypothetical protein